MKKITLLSAFSFVFLAFNSFGQLYESIYANSGAEVQMKIDQNKIAGTDMLSGLKSSHIIGVTSLSNTQKVQLESNFNNSEKVISFIIKSDLSSIFIETVASVTKEDIEAQLSSLNIVLTGYSVEYSINE